MIIGDEAHNLGAESLASCLPEVIKLRLALSATPERHFDEAGTERIFDYFGPVLEPEFTLRDAIQAGALVQYTYTPILIELTPEEVERYAELTVAIGRALGMGGRDNNTALERLLFERARLLCTAENKLTQLRVLMADRLNTDHTLFYCGDGSVEDETTDESRRQLEAVTELLNYRLGYIEDAIGSVLPSSLHRYFFFDGERIEQIVKTENPADMATAIKTLLSVEMLERGINHLDYARKQLEKELRDIGDTETKRLVSEKTTLEEEKTQKEARREAIVQDLLDQEDLKQRYSAQLRDLDKVKEIQQRRDTLQSQMEDLEQQLARSEDRLRPTISSRGYMVFLGDTIAQFKELAADLRRKGELPAGIKRQFVQDLLDQEACICGAQLTAGTANRQEVETWLGKGGLQDVEDAVIKMGGEVESLERQIPEFWAEIDQEQASIENLRQRIAHLQDQIGNIRNQLKGNGEDATVAASTGQNQILSLAFIGSVIDRVRYWSKKHSAIGLDGGGFPIVMDSPFGSLDSVNRSNIAQAITTLADQQVVLVSKTQWLNEVEREMEPAVGAEYVLVYYTAKEVRNWRRWSATGEATRW